MSERPFMQLYVSDYLGDTRHLSCEQHGAYLLLLMTMWNAGGELPNDDTKLSRIVCLSLKKWKVIKEDVLGFFDVSEAVISNNRLTKELQKSDSKSQSRASAGAKGGAAKSLKTKKPALANASVLPQHLPDTITIQKESSLRSDTSGSLFPVPDEAQQAFDDWNKLAAEKGLAVALALSDQRRTRIKARIGEAGGLDGWRKALQRLVQSPFLLGDNDSGFRADLDFVLQAKSFAKLREGGYDRAPRTNGHSEPAKPKYGNAVVKKLDELTEDDWQKRLDYCRPRREWLAALGPPPFAPGCKVPPHMLEERDRTMMPEHVSH